MRNQLFVSLLFFFSCTLQAQQMALYEFSVTTSREVRIQATLPLKNSIILMQLRGTSDDLPNGTAEFVENLKVTDKKGKVIRVENLPEGQWRLDTQLKQVNISYTIKLDHEKYSWDGYGGIDGVSFVNADGIFGTGYTFFIVPDSLEVPATVKTILPNDWKFSAPWKQITSNQFQTATLDDLLNNCFLIDTHYEQKITAGDFEITMAIGGTLKNHAPLFGRILRGAIQQYWKIFQSANIKKYLVTLNAGSMTDGETFNSSFNQLIKGTINEDGIISWGNILAHETFHLWNGISMYSSQQNEWFKEGFTEYMSVKTLRRAGLIDDALLLKKIESFHTRYWIGRNITSREVTLKDAGSNKSANVFLLYGGGSLVAFMMDVEIRKATQNKKGIENLMHALYARYSNGRTYTQKDLEKVLDEVAGKPVSLILTKLINEESTFSTETYLYDCGLGLTTFAEENYLYFIDAHNPHNTLFESMFLE